MGWIFMDRDRGVTHQQWLTGELGPAYTLVDLAAKLDAIYAAVQNNRTGHIEGLVITIQWLRTSYTGNNHNFGYKDVAETSGPLHTDCPKRILDLLTPANVAYTGTAAQAAQQWRDACQDKLRRRQTARTVRLGTVIQAPHKIRFTDGAEGDLFAYTGHRNWFRLVIENPRTGELEATWRDYTLSGWRTMDFTVIPNITVEI